MAQNKRVELLAPAGNIEGFYGAIHAGADAVYLGGSRFGARAYADNFSEEELVNCIRYAHLWGRKVYLTINTLIKESEIQDIYEYLLPYYEAGLDGVIVQDIGALAYIREHFPSLEIHGSTQMTITGEYGAKFLQTMGVCRIVPARELNLEEIKHIKKSTGLSMETFIHGAMCYCYSGQCLFSSILGGRSGNRGRCAQPCRLPYEIKVGKHVSGECYPLSLKDMCTIEHIPDLIEGGIDSFKIEGRMKKPEYTAGVTAIYRKYIDKYYEGIGKLSENHTAFKYKIDSADMKALSCLYIRSEKQDGYYYRPNGKDMVTLESPAYSGSDEALLARIRRDFVEAKPRKSLSVYADFITGKKAVVTVVAEEATIVVEGDVVQTASKQPITKENIIKQLGKLGDSIFTADRMEITVSEDAFYPLRAINELRREAIHALENSLIEQNGFPVRRTDASLKSSDPTTSMFEKSDEDTSLCLSVRRTEQLTAVAETLAIRKTTQRFARIYLDGDLLVTDGEKVLQCCKELSKYCEMIIALPHIIRKKDYSLIKNTMLSVIEQYPGIFTGVQVRSMEAIGLLKESAYQKKIYGDAGFYVWNRKTLENLPLDGFCMPLELRSGEQRSLLRQNKPCEKMIYGRIPMMITANCVANTTYHCQKQSGERIVYLTDRYRKSFPVELNCTHCMNIIYNSVPLSLHGELDKWLGQADFRLDFTVENKQETAEVIEYFTDLLWGREKNKAPQPPYKEYTTGHEKRGVE